MIAFVRLWAVWVLIADQRRVPVARLQGGAAAACDVGRHLSKMDR
jgi:hypothetical protein